MTTSPLELDGLRISEGNARRRQGYASNGVSSSSHNSGIGGSTVSAATRRSHRMSMQFLPIQSDSESTASVTSSPRSPSVPALELSAEDKSVDNKSELISPKRRRPMYGEVGGSLILRRIQKTRDQSAIKSPELRESSESGIRELQHNFNERRSESGSGSKVGWEFWAQVVEDYAEFARSRPAELRSAIQIGFPAELRGLLWQLIAESKSPALEQMYPSLSGTDAPCTATIAKDVDRTALSGGKADAEALGRILRAYSLFDPEVGYTQGMAFVATLLLDVDGLTEVEAFCLFIQLMKMYDMRSFYLPEMPGLHLKLYQFDRLVEDRLESVHIHLKRQGIHSSMYASQWFLTLFSYKFPVELVLRILDIVVAEGLEAMLRFAFVLMASSVNKILSLKFDELLPWLKENVFDDFAKRPNDLVKAAAAIELTPGILAQYELEFSELGRIERERTEQVDSLRTANSRLTLQVRQLETELGQLTSEHVEIANKMVESGLELARLRHENEEMARELQTYRAASEQLSETASVIRERDDLVEVRQRLEHQIVALQEAMAQNLA